MTMPRAVRCPECGTSTQTDLIEGRLEGLCPGCLVALAIGPEGSLAVEGPRTPPLPPEVSKADPTARVGKFILAAKLGSGASGEVWKAWDTVLSRWVALKIFHEEDSEERARFTREAETAARLNHPNIAAIFEVGQDRNRQFLAIQYVEGATLQKFPRRDRNLLVRIIRDAARAVGEAHRQGIVHRDLKPANIAVARHGEDPRHPHVYVLDFGLARRLEGGDKVTASGIVVGTPAYMPPEQARGEEVDGRADTYALGATLYELLTKSPPFRGANVYEVLRKVQEQEPRSPHSIDSTIPRDLDRIVLKALEKDANRRYASAGALADDLDRFLNGEAVEARGPDLFYRLRLGLAKRKAVAAIIAVALLAILAVVGLSKSGEHQRESARSEASSLVDLARLKIDQMAQLLSIDEDRTADLENLELSARKELTEASLRFPEHDGASFEMGRMCALLGKEDEARSHYTRAIERAPRQVRSYLDRAALNLDVYEKLRHDVDSGESRSESGESARILALVNADLEKVRELSTSLAHLKYSEGMLLFAQGKFPEAAAKLEEYLNLVPADAEAWLWRGHALLHSDAQDQAIEALTRAAVLRPREAQTYLFRGTAHKNRGRHEEAIADSSRAIERDPKLAMAYYNRGNARGALRRFDDAIEDFSMAFKLNPRHAAAVFNRGVSKGAKGLRDEEIADYTTALQVYPKYERALLNRGVAKASKGLLEEAILDYTDAITLNPKLAFAYYNRGMARDQQGRLDEAIKDYNAALEINPKYSKAYSNRGKVLNAKGLHAEAVADFTSAIDLDPKFAVAFFNRGVAKRSLKEFESAGLDFEQAVALNESNAAACVAVAGMDAQRGDLDGALEWLERALTKGYKDLAKLERDSFLDPLRKDERYVQLVEKLKQK